MLFATHFVSALFIALLLSAVFALGFRRIGPWPNFWAYFFILFLAVWAGGAWISPVGPQLLGVYWLPFFLVGLIMALLFAVTAPQSKPRTRSEAIRRTQQEKGALAVFGLFFWAVVLIFTLAIIARYVS